MLFDMRRDITELRARVDELMSGGGVRKEEVSIYTPTHEIELQKTPSQPTIHIPSIRREPDAMHHNVMETEEYIEETLSLDDMERMAILRALDRHRGKRRDAAKELNISERTLYRKIKEYGLD